jgi:hypothetical protein
VIGAAIGGLTAAITGGDIGKGVLFGAIGGVVTAGVGHALYGAGTPALAGTSGTSSATGLAQYNMRPEAFAGGGGGAAATKAAEEGVKASLASKILEGTGSAAVQGSIAAAGSVLAAQGEAEASELALEWQDKMETRRLDSQERMHATSNETQMHIAGANNKTALLAKRMEIDVAREQLGEQRRQYDTNLEEARAKRERRNSALAGLRPVAPYRLIGDSQEEQEDPTTEEPVPEQPPTMLTSSEEEEQMQEDKRYGLA